MKNYLISIILILFMASPLFGQSADEKSVDLSFQHGFSTKSGTGRGVGLSLVHENLQFLSGHLSIVRSFIGGMRFTIYIPK